MQPVSYPPQHPYPANAYQPYPTYGYALPYGYAVPVPPAPRHVRRDAKVAVVAAAFVVLAQLCQVVVGWPSGAQTADARASGQFAEPSAWLITMFVSFLALAIAYVFGALWLWHARSNAAAMSPSYRFSLPRGWAWAGWVTPVVALWFPFLVVRDTLRATRPGSEQIALGWFAAWLLWVITDYWVPIVVSDSDSTAIRLLGPWEVLNFGMCLGAFILWLQVVRRVTRIQNGWLEGTAA